MDGEYRVTAADLVRHFGALQDEATRRPVFVTHHGRDRYVLQSAPHYVAMRSRAAMATAGGIGDDLIDQISEGMMLLDEELAVTAINPAAAALLKLDRQSTIGTCPFDEEAGRRSLFFRNLAHTLHSGAAVEFDAPSPAFADRWLRVRTVLHRDRVACLMHDVTETIRARQREERADAIACAVAAHGAIASARLSSRGTFEWVDAAFAAMIGLSEPALAGARLVDVLPVARRHEAGQMLESVLAGGGVQAFSTALLCNDGGERSVRLAIAGIRDDHGRSGAIAIATAD